ERRGELALPPDPPTDPGRQHDLHGDQKPSGPEPDGDGSHALEPPQSGEHGPAGASEDHTFERVLVRCVPVHAAHHGKFLDFLYRHHSTGRRFEYRVRGSAGCLPPVQSARHRYTYRYRERLRKPRVTHDLHQCSHDRLDAPADTAHYT